MTPSPGDYDEMGVGAERVVTGDCAKCGLVVKPGEPHRILYHPTQPGGIFHAGCAPTEIAWYPIDDTLEAEDG